MSDNRKYLHYLNCLESEKPELASITEAIKSAFLESVDPISKTEVKALKEFPVQYIDKIDTDDDWTTQLHIWAEQGVDELLDIDPIYFVVRDSNRDTMLSSLVKGALGLYTDMVDYVLIKNILDTDFTYEDLDENEDIVIKNALDCDNGNGDNSLDILVDYAWSQDQYENTDEDIKLQDILKEFASNYNETKVEIEEMTEESEDEPEDESEDESTVDDSDKPSD